MKLIDSNLACPSCQTTLRPKVLACPHCDIKVEGPFQLNEFATLAADDLHFLRIFVRCEGRIREMESSLGLSYPTIRARLTALKHKLAGEETAEGKPAEADNRDAGPDAGQILAKLQAGEIPFDEAMKQIKRLRVQTQQE